MSRFASPSPLWTVALWSFVLDLVLVIAFAAIGRASHAEGVLGPGGSGLVQTAWPFVVALIAGWSIVQAWRLPTALVRTAVPLWAITLVLGMTLRSSSGQGVQVAFVIVTAVTLAVFLIGWRAIALLARSTRARRQESRAGAHPGGRGIRPS